MEIERDCVNTTYSMLQETIQKQHEALVKDLERLVKNPDPILRA